MRITYFNARLREGGDHALILLISERVKFQSTPPRRRRLYHFSILLQPILFSIHASAKEATISLPFWILIYSFQSTPPRRRRRNTPSLSSSIRCFQSTPPRRRRLGLVFLHPSCKTIFNPRLREGGDLIVHDNVYYVKIFNPRLREGGDLLYL